MHEDRRWDQHVRLQRQLHRQWDDVRRNCRVRDEQRRMRQYGSVYEHGPEHGQVRLQ
jgi:hypothetical protein